MAPGGTGRGAGRDIGLGGGMKTGGRDGACGVAAHALVAINKPDKSVMRFEIKRIRPFSVDPLP